MKTKFLKKFKQKYLVVLTACGLLGLVGAATWYYRQSQSLLVSGEVFCQGEDQRFKKQYTIKWLAQKPGHGKAAVFARKSSEATWQQEKLDENTFVSTDSASFPSRLSLKINDNQRLQIYRECGKTPVCRLEEFSYPSPQQMKKVQQETLRLERQAFEARKTAAEIAQQFGQLRTIAAKSKDSATAKKANLVAEQLHNASVRIAEIMRKHDDLKNKTSKISPQTTDLYPQTVNDWCD